MPRARKAFLAIIVYSLTSSFNLISKVSVVEGSGGGQSPMLDIPSGLFSVTEKCWSRYSINHQRLRRTEHSWAEGPGTRNFGWRCSPIECANRIVTPNRVQASCILPRLVRYRPIMRSVLTPRRVGSLMKEALRKACMLAVTAR